VSLPFELAEEKNIREKPQSLRSISWHRAPSILLAEDNAVNQEVAATYLEHLGCQVVIAGDGRKALKHCESTVFDLIFMDCQMPNLNGYEATRRIREIENNDKRNIIIALTAHSTSEDRNKCIEAGMNDYMGKPYRLETLQDIIIKWLPSLIKELHEAGSALPQNLLPTEAPNQYSKKQPYYHDMRNILAGALGNVELALLKIEDSAQAKKNLGAALAALKKAVSFLSEMEKAERDG
jgi:CheY-like chemotaxis protein